MKEVRISKISIAPYTLCEVLGDEALLVHLPSEFYSGHNEVGMRIWQS